MYVDQLWMVLVETNCVYLLPLLRTHWKLMDIVSAVNHKSPTCDALMNCYKDLDVSVKDYH